MKQRNIRIGLGIVFSGFVMAGLYNSTGCLPKVKESGSSKDPTSAQLVLEARNALETQNVAIAKGKFEQAYALDPNNKDANLGVAMTKVIMLIEDPDVVNIIRKWDMYAPSVKNIIYNVLNNTFEVYGSNTPYYGRDPAKDGLTKLITYNTTSPYTYTGPFLYYIIYTPPFSKVQIDAVFASSGNAINPYTTSGEIECFPNPWEWNIGAAGDGRYITLGGAEFDGSFWVLKANANSLNVMVYTIGSATAKYIAPLTNLTKSTKSISAPTQTSDESVQTSTASRMYSQFTTLSNKLPKNKTSLLKQVRKAIASAIPSTAPTVSEMQAVIDNKILPVINDAINKFRFVQGEGYTFTITPPMTGNAEVVNTILDDGEFYAYDSLLNIVKMGLLFITAYNLNVDWNIIEADPLSCINGPSGGLTSTVNATQFFTLKSNGAAKMNTALAALREAVDKAELCYNFVFNQWGYTGIDYLNPTRNPHDNGMKWHDPGDYCSFPKKEDTDTRQGLDVCQMVLTGTGLSTLTVVVSGGTETTTLSTTASSMILSTEVTTKPDSTESFVFNVTKFFTSPLTRADLPTFGYDLPINGTLSQVYKNPTYQYLGVGWDGVQGTEDDQTVESEAHIKSDLPDWTFNGMFPNKPPGEPDALVYLDSAVLLNQAVWEGWGSALASDGTSIYLAKNDYPNWNIHKINPSTGALITTYPITITLSNYYQINDITWHKGELWASATGESWSDGWYYYKRGVFRINLVTGLPENEIAITSTSWTSFGGLASDNTYLYAGYSGGVIRFLDTETTLPSTPFFTLDDTPDSMSYDGTNLWCGDYDEIKKVNPTNGTVIKRYWSYADGGGLLYWNNKIWMVDEDRLLSLTAP
ncbi:MAG: hypothetical protein QME51_04375 [Planctomycetota bacterium]|nr:hypothetical protein [Planctomycetota bacterium]MDI6787586.1 hypothetical protein [Planctomycetota bacterium]